LDLGAPDLPKPPKSNWVASSWGELEGFNTTSIHEVWSTLVAGCEKPHPSFKSLCPNIRAQSLSSESEQRQWLMDHVQPYQITAKESSPQTPSREIGLLTSYYEPELLAQLSPDAVYQYPLFAPPASLGLSHAQGKPWYTRQEIESSSVAQSELKGKALAWLSDPVDVMIVHIQGSARLKVISASTPASHYRLKYAASNDQPYTSMARWMIDQGLLKDASWPSIRQALQAHPERAQEALWSNPRYIFFTLEPLIQPQAGPTGAWGVPLLAGRSLAVDTSSVPLGLPIWLSSKGANAMNLLALSQDTGGAIQGAVRADLFAGTGDAAGTWAGQIKQPLKMWVLWPKTLVK
jgi:membrane-bound lytic murein transglycosylase A